jgi:hypothetical protein
LINNFETQAAFLREGRFVVSKVGLNLQACSAPRDIRLREQLQFSAAADAT